jgi:hypothetical protein
MYERQKRYKEEIARLEKEFHDYRKSDQIKNLNIKTIMEMPAAKSLLE